MHGDERIGSVFMAIEPREDADEAAWRAYANSLPGKRMGVGCLLF